MPDNDELNMPEEIEEDESEQGSKWNWIGSESRPEAKKSSDGISDLFEVDSDNDTDDLLKVDIEKDIMDGDLSDITEVTEEDIMGDDIYGQSPLDEPVGQRTKRIPPRSGIIRRPISPPITGIQGMGR